MDVTEAQWMMIIIHLLTAILGPDVWSVDVLAPLSLPVQLPIKTAILLFMCGVSCRDPC